MAKILLAEDDSAMREFLTAALTRAGHDVAATANGLEALQTLEHHHHYDLLLTDIVMPGMDGIELARLATTACPAMKVMFITGFSAVSLGNMNLEQNHAKIMSKPFHLSDLVEQIDRLLAAA